MCIAASGRSSQYLTLGQKWTTSYTLHYIPIQYGYPLVVHFILKKKGDPRKFGKRVKEKQVLYNTILFKFAEKFGKKLSYHTLSRYMYIEKLPCFPTIYTMETSYEP